MAPEEGYDISEDWDKADEDDEDIPIEEPIDVSEPLKVISLRSLIHSRIRSLKMRRKNGLKMMTRAISTANN